MYVSNQTKIHPRWLQFQTINKIKTAYAVFILFIENYFNKLSTIDLKDSKG